MPRYNNLKVGVAMGICAILIGLSAQDTQAADSIRLCTGGKGGNYEFSGLTMKKMASDWEIEVLNTKGSWDNVQKIKKGECDAAIVQEDAVMSFNRTENLQVEPLADLYPEAFHLVCSPDSGIDDLTDLIGTTKKVALGKPGSGPWVSWRNLVEADERYGSVVTSTESGSRAASKVKQGLIDCFLAVSGVGSASLNRLDEKYGEDTVLVEVRDKDLQNHVGMAGGPLYRKSEIPEETYPHWTPDSWGDSSVETVAVMAKLVVSADLGDDPIEAILMAVEDALPTIHERVGYQSE